VEVDEDTASLRAFDRNGRPLELPTQADRRRFGVTEADRGPGWDPRLFAVMTPDGLPPTPGAGGFYAETAQTDRRRFDLNQRYTRSARRVRGLDRYVVTEGADTRELLVLPETALPVEVNVVRAGVLTSRVQLRYARAGAAGYVRQAVHAERPAGPASPGDLVVTDLTFSDIEVATRGGR
jgi:hypothetical protein